MPDVRGLRVLVFGDSLSAGQFSPGAVMAQKLGAAGATVKVDALVGRSANNFFGRENAAAHFADAKAFDPDLVIVELGTNDIGLSMTVDQTKMTQLRDGLARTGAEIWAFGPPQFPSKTFQAGAPAVVSMMRSVFGSRFIDLRPETSDLLVVRKDRTADGIHFTAAGGATLGARMAARFQHASESGGDGMVVMVGVLAIAAYFLFR